MTGLLDEIAGTESQLQPTLAVHADDEATTSAQHVPSLHSMRVQPDGPYPSADETDPLIIVCAFQKEISSVSTVHEGTIDEWKADAEELHAALARGDGTVLYNRCYAMPQFRNLALEPFRHAVRRFSELLDRKPALDSAVTALQHAADAKKFPDSLALPAALRAVLNDAGELAAVEASMWRALKHDLNTTQRERCLVIQDTQQDWRKHKLCPLIAEAAAAVDAALKAPLAKAIGRDIAIRIGVTWYGQQLQDVLLSKAASRVSGEKRDRKAARMSGGAAAAPSADTAAKEAPQLSPATAKDVIDGQRETAAIDARLAALEKSIAEQQHVTPPGRGGQNAQKSKPQTEHRPSAGSKRKADAAPESAARNPKSQKPSPPSSRDGDDKAGPSQGRGGRGGKSKHPPWWGKGKKGKNAKKRVRYRARMQLRSECSLLGMHFSQHDTHVLCEGKVPNLPLQVLGLGPKYVPSTEPAAALTAHEASLRLTDFGRRVLWRAALESQPHEAPPRFLVKRPLSEHAPWPARRALRSTTLTTMTVVRGHALQLSNLVNSFRSSACMYRNNLPLPLRAAVQQLSSLCDRIVIRPADKNMGMVLVDKAWYQEQCQTHLGDCSKFTAVSQAIADRLPDVCTQRLQQHLADNRMLANMAFGMQHSDALHKYLCEPRTYTVPPFYGIIKVHKPVPAIRPIVASHSWVTTPLAQITAHEIHADMMAQFPHILEDSKALVRDLERLTFSPSDLLTTFLITGDVNRLYVVIPQQTCLTKTGRHLKPLLQRCGRRNAALRAEWLTRAAKFVFSNTYMRFGDSTWHQVSGIPMGSPLSPDIANLFMALIEDLHGEWEHAGESLASLLPQPECLRLFRRLIDDYTIILSQVTAHQVQQFLRKLDERLAAFDLQVDWCVSTDECDTLDLHVYKPPDMASTGKLAFRTHSKRGNRYAYLHRASMHNPHVFRSLVRTEVYRHAVNCSTHTWFWHMVRLFRTRLLARGYRAHEVDAIIDSIDYSVRLRLLYGTDAETQQRTEQDNPVPFAEQPIRVFLKMPYDVITANIAFPKAMRAMLTDMTAALTHVEGAEKVLAALPRIVPIVCWQRADTVARSFMRSDDC